MVVNNRIWVGVAVILIIAIVLMGWFLGINPRLSEVTANGVQRQSVLAQNDIHRAELERLKQENEKLDDYKDDLTALQRKLPPKNDLSTFLGDLNELEVASGVILTNFTSTEAQPFVLDPTSAPADTTEGAPPAAVQTLDPNEFVVIDISLTVSGDQAAILNFVEALQNTTRRFLVTSLKISTSGDGTYTGIITGYVYVLIDPSKPVVEEEEPVAEPEPAPSASPSSEPAPSSSPSPSGSPTP